MYLGCADSDFIPSNPSNYSRSIDHVDVLIPFSRVLKPIAGPPMSRTVMPGSFIGKLLDLCGWPPATKSSY
jgi:hypothetical protein